MSFLSSCTVPTRTPNASFTLMEVLIALAVFLIGVVSVISMFTTGTSLHQSSQRSSAATDLVEEVYWQTLRELDDVPEAQLIGGTYQRAARALPGHEGFFQAYEVTPRGDGTYLLRVTLTWKEGGKELSKDSRFVLNGVRSLARQVERASR